VSGEQVSIEGASPPDLELLALDSGCTSARQCLQRAVQPDRERDQGDHVDSPWPTAMIRLESRLRDINASLTSGERPGATSWSEQGWSETGAAIVPAARRTNLNGRQRPGRPAEVAVFAGHRLACGYPGGQVLLRLESTLKQAY